MKHPDIPVTNAVRALRSAGVAVVPHFYDYVDHGGTRHAATSLGVDEHAVIKTLVMKVQDKRERFILVLMHGDREVSTKQLARILQVKTVAPADDAEVTKCSGYMPGGVSPFGTRTSMPVYVEESILDLELIYINGGKRGFLVGIQPAELKLLRGAVPVQVGIKNKIA